MKQLVIALVCATFLLGCKKEEEPEPTPEPKRTVEYNVTGFGSYMIHWRDQYGQMQSGNFSNGMTVSGSFEKGAELTLISALYSTTATIKVNGVVLVMDDVPPISINAVVP